SIQVPRTLGALCPPRRGASRWMRPPKLLAPSPTADTSSPDAPSLRFSTGFPSCALLRAREPQNLARLLGGGDLAPQPLRDAHHAFDQHGVVLGELARRHIGIVLVADPHVPAEC